MKYLGIVKKEKGAIIVPDTFNDIPDGQSFEAIEIGGDILFLPSPLNRDKLSRIQQLAEISIKEHRKSLEGLAK